MTKRHKRPSPEELLALEVVAPTPSQCTVPGCLNPHRARGWCTTHYANWAHHGEPLPPVRRSVAERFWPKVEFTDSCWLWRASLSVWGYGRFSLFHSKPVMAHRWSYEFCVGTIPPGLRLDHLCRTPACVNPDHLEPVTNRENILRGESGSAINARKTHCKRGHPFDVVYFRRNGRSYRACTACWRVEKPA